MRNNTSDNKRKTVQQPIRDDTSAPAEASNVTAEANEITWEDVQNPLVLFTATSKDIGELVEETNYYLYSHCYTSASKEAEQRQKFMKAVHIEHVNYLVRVGYLEVTRQDSESEAGQIRWEDVQNPLVSFIATERKITELIEDPMYAYYSTCYDYAPKGVEERTDRLRERHVERLNHLVCMGFLTMHKTKASPQDVLDVLAVETFAPEVEQRIFLAG